MESTIIDTSPTDEHGAFTLAEFCQRYRLNRVTLFRLRRAGLGPEEIHAGRKVLISRRSALAWEAMMQARAREARSLNKQTETPM
ncbi:hypothetical protein [Paraburkholderia sp. JHI869]|uniref:hypothetical protein n=1 Tax=Paraburkholderia sp. JHI869 TaxID=3112959 RepID=UPI00317665C9